MGQIDKVKEELNVLRDDYRHFFIVLMTIITGSFAALYQIILGKAPVWIVFISLIGIMISGFIAALLKKKRYDIDKKLIELEEL
ncbi:hypothetical protein [Sulfurovum riftiae]|uniref:Uncharacterized protein n=1 Tax=Sulfurovum riftiae TaxID=1630136 RepID=A0A151CG82_9BACT|nr:hypothetical protein [Sulfurovum riftiae]KYJ86293.1 hypothetical protein AS592_05715 [Sulfurovum riftiae]